MTKTLAESTPDNPLFTEYNEIYLDLISWRLEWLRDNYPTLLHTCERCHEELCLCLPELSFPPSNEYFYTGAEFLALLLILTSRLKERWDCSALDKYEITMGHALKEILERRVIWLRENLWGFLNLPCFGRAMSDVLGITEGRCRSLLPVWALAQSAAHHSSNGKLNWWSQLNDRLNYGVY